MGYLYGEGVPQLAWIDRCTPRKVRQKGSSGKGRSSSFTARATLLSLTSVLPLRWNSTCHNLSPGLTPGSEHSLAPNIGNDLADARGFLRRVLNPRCVALDQCVQDAQDVASYTPNFDTLHAGAGVVQLGVVIRA